MYSKKGLTLLQLILTMLISMVMVSIMVPQFSNMFERARAEEGRKILWDALSSMKRFEVDNGSYPNNQASLDIIIPNLEYFHTPLVISNTCGSGAGCARTSRKGGLYSLAIRENGTFICQGAGCAAAGF